MSADATIRRAIVELESEPNQLDSKIAALRGSLSARMEGCWADSARPIPVD